MTVQNLGHTGIECRGETVLTLGHTGVEGRGETPNFRSYCWWDYRRNS